MQIHEHGRSMTRIVTRTSTCALGARYRPGVLAIFVFLVGLLSPSVASSHPLKLSASLIDYDPGQQGIRVQCKVFMDDFQLSLINSVLKGRDPRKVRKEDRPRLIEEYFDIFFHIQHNGRKLPWKVQSLTPLYKENVLVIRFKWMAAKLAKGDTLALRNTMFFRDFGYEQTNRMVVRIPSFGIEDAHAATIRDFTFYYELGQAGK